MRLKNYNPKFFIRKGGKPKGLRGEFTKRPRLAMRGKGGQNSQKIGHIVNGWPLMIRQ